MTSGLKLREELRQSAAGLSKDQRKQCEVSTLECRMDVNDARDAVLRSHPSIQCRSSADSNAEMECVLKDLTTRGEAAVASNFVRKDNWCLRQLLTCAAQASQSAEAQAKQTRFDERKERVEASPEAVQARALAAFAEEKNSYLRSVLPPEADGDCADLGRLAQCQKDATALVTDYERDLNREEASYDELAVRRRYESVQRAKAECHEPEFQCLSSRLNNFGGNAETQKLIAQSLVSLKKRELLLLQAGEEAGEPCLTSGVESHQRRIVDDYQRFAREPVLFFQAQLHKDFRVLYDAQISCLQAATRGRGRPNRG